MAAFRDLDGYPQEAEVREVVIVPIADGRIVLPPDGLVQVVAGGAYRDAAFAETLRRTGVRGQGFHPFALSPVRSGGPPLSSWQRSSQWIGGSPPEPPVCSGGPPLSSWQRSSQWIGGSPPEPPGGVLAAWIDGELRDAPGPRVVLSPEEATARYGELVRRAWESFQNQTDESYWNDTRRWLEDIYLNATTVEGGSGHGGDARSWRASKRLHVEAIRSDGTFLDTGCANGLLMESMVQWAAEEGYRLEPYGLDISERMGAEARRRLPVWAERIFVGNVIDWRPPMRFDYVCTRLEYVPERRRTELVRRLLDEFLSPGGRLIVTSYGCTARPQWAGMEVGDHLRRMGFEVSGEPVSVDRAKDRVYRIAFIDG